MMNGEFNYEDVENKGWNMEGFFSILPRISYHSSVYANVENCGSYEDYVKRVKNLNFEINIYKPPRRPKGCDKLKHFEKYVYNYKNIENFRKNRENIHQYIYEHGIFDIPNFEIYCTKNKIKREFHIEDNIDKSENVGEVIKILENFPIDAKVSLSTVGEFCITVDDKKALDDYFKMVNEKLVSIIAMENLI